jgi:uncharacterized protein (DUF697 family)/tellurite resistance protein
MEEPMPTDAETVLQIGLAAAKADGQRDDRELAQLGALARSMGIDPTTLAAASDELPADLTDRLSSDDARRTAYELAVAVCQCDGPANPAESAFLADLRAKLGIAASAVAEVHREAEALGTSAVAVPQRAAASSVDELILKQAKLAGALELLPQSLATMAIIPLQMRMVYEIGRTHGQTLDAAQVKDLLGTVGIGMAAQVLDGFARKLVGGVAKGVLGRVLGGLAGGVAGAAAGAATAFATTYALGKAAAQYYAQGRSLSTADLQGLFARLRDEASRLYPQVREQVEAQAKGLDVRQVLASLER